MLTGTIHIKYASMLMYESVSMKHSESEKYAVVKTSYPSFGIWNVTGLYEKNNKINVLHKHKFTVLFH